jgi:hypothetical protein
MTTYKSQTLTGKLISSSLQHLDFDRNESLHCFKINDFDRFVASEFLSLEEN